jgi:hypothetical protein
MTLSHEANGKFALGQAKLRGRKKGTANTALAARQVGRLNLASLPARRSSAKTDLSALLQTP